MGGSYGEKYRYDSYTWEEFRDLIRQDRVILIPVGTVEDHGPHLPLDTDNFILDAMCHAAAAKVPEDVLLLPLIPYGFDAHHLDFPGTIDVDGDNLQRFVLDITRSLSYHGFRRILLANGHGSNAPYLEAAARKTVIQTGAICASFITYNLAREAIAEVRQSEWPGGICHACEMETSVYLYLDSARVRTDKIVKEISLPRSEFIWRDTIRPSPVSMMDWWSRSTTSGVVGDPTMATIEKGKNIFEAVVNKMAELILEFRRRPIGDRVDHHQRG